MPDQANEREQKHEAVDVRLGAVLPGEEVGSEDWNGHEPCGDSERSSRRSEEKDGPRRQRRLDCEDDPEHEIAVASRDRLGEDAYAHPERVVAVRGGDRVERAAVSGHDVSGYL